MLTPQEITEKGFVKAVFGGYDMTEVDDFLESVSADYNALFKENAILKGKLKVLVEKVEEYRSTEDAMRMALLTAQRMGEEITVEATRNKEEMLQSAESEIKAKLTETAKRVAEEEMRLAAASKETAKFLELSQAIMRKHSEFLKKLETAHRSVKPKRTAEPAAQPAPRPAPPPVQSPAPSPPPVHVTSPVKAPVMPPPVPLQDDDVDSIAAQIGSAVESITNSDMNMPQTPVAYAPAPPTHTPSAEPPPPLFDNGDETIKLYSTDENLDDTSPRPKFDFDDLKFGANFDNDE